MESPLHPLAELFQQLGLPSEGVAVAAFVARHGPLPAGTALPDAPFWSPAQAAFLREGIERDADWSEAIDTLAIMLSV